MRKATGGEKKIMGAHRHFSRKKLVYKQEE